MIYNSEKCVNIEERRMNKMIMATIIILDHVNLLKKESSIYCIQGNTRPCFIFPPFALVDSGRIKDWTNYNAPVIPL